MDISAMLPHILSHIRNKGDHIMFSGLFDLIDSFNAKLSILFNPSWQFLIGPLTDTWAWTSRAAWCLSGHTAGYRKICPSDKVRISSGRRFPANHGPPGRRRPAISRKSWSAVLLARRRPANHCRRPADGPTSARWASEALWICYLLFHHIQKHDMLWYQLPGHHW